MEPGNFLSLIFGRRKKVGEDMDIEQTVIPAKKRRWLWITAIGMLVVLLGVSSFGLYLYLNLKQTADKMYQPLPQNKPVYVSHDHEVKQKVVETAKLDKLSPFSVLLLGVDQRPSDRGRSDTIVVLTVNPKAGEVFMFNIPRDTRTRIVKKGFDDKINHAYAFDGIEGSLVTVENFVDMPIDYYMEVNMDGFKTIVDLLHGVDINNPFSFDYEGHSFPKGAQHLNGELALKYSRMRYDDPRGDFGRNDRQRQILKDVIKRAGSWKGVTELPDILNQVGNYVKTNLTFSQMQDLFTKYRTTVKNVVTTEIHGKGAKINGIYYYLVDEKEKARIHEEMKRRILDKA
jgi:polyisoprenyl-teichoic acid--peptidoglycan teichoic acid transferase